MGDCNLAGNIYPEAKASIVFSLVAGLLAPHEGVENLKYRRSPNNPPTVVDAKFHLARRSSYCHIHWSVIRSIFDCIQNEIVQHLLKSVRIPSSTRISADLQFNLSARMTHAQLL